MVTKTPEELRIMRLEHGDEAVKQNYEDEARNVFGHDAKKDKHGKYIEQGRGSAANPTEQHYQALARAEGAAAAAAARKRDAERAGR